MAIRAHFFGISTVFSVVLASGAFAPVAAESFVLEHSAAPAQPTSLGEPTTEERSSAVQAPIDAPPALPTAAAMDTPSVEQTDAGLDPIAEAFAESTRLSVRVDADAPEFPAYPVSVNSQVQFFVDRFTIYRREVVSVWVNRSARYLGMVRDVMRKRGLPEELAFTAMIESGYNPDAVSHAGAKGMWQFMAPTARRYGLRVDQWVDERLDPEKSTVAAAAYLRDLYALFGSWPLAQAAYNAGEVKVARAIRVTGSNDFWTLARTNHLRRETKEFVPQIHAATVIGRDPERFGFEFEDRPAPATETVSVPPATDLRRLSATAGIPYDTLRTMNSVLVRGVTPPGARYDLKVPVGARDGVSVALAPRRAPLTVAAVKPRTARAGRNSSSADVHIVRPRETVSAIAKLYGVSVGDVVRWNRLERQDSIRPGDRLRVAADLRQAAERDVHGAYR
jgi:membrane-bound lytic murein transglycosylase D